MNEQSSLSSVILLLISQFITQNAELAVRPLEKTASPPIKDLHKVTRRIWLAYVIGSQELLPTLCSTHLPAAVKMLEEEEDSESLRTTLFGKRFSDTADLAIYYVEATRIWNASSELALLEKMAENEADISAADLSGDPKAILAGVVRSRKLSELVRTAGSARPRPSVGAGIMGALVEALLGGASGAPKDVADDCDCAACQLRRKLTAATGDPAFGKQPAASAAETGEKEGRWRPSGEADLSN